MRPWSIPCSSANMSDYDKQVHEMTRRIQAAIIPAIDGEPSEIVMPAVVQVAVTLAMFLAEIGPSEAADGIIQMLEDAKRSGAN